MIFAAMMLILVGVIGFFHYTQGFFSATISAILAIFAACLAVGYHESVVTSMLQGKFADQANAICLVVIFAVTYFVLRLMFDKFIPGNIRLPAIVDKVGAGIMGAIAGIFCAGIVAIAAQTLPFGPSIGLYSRYSLGDERDVQIPTQGSAQDAKIYDEMKNDTFVKADNKGLMLPVDDMVVSTVDYLSRDGSLAGDRALRDVHPSYLDELFGNRIGIQTGVKRSALNLAGHEDVKVEGLYSLDHVAQTDAEMAQLRNAAKKTGDIKPKESEIMLVVRALFSKDATDNDSIFRFSPGSARLVASGENFYPIGTLEKGNLLLANRVDDFLFVKVANDDRGADLVYVVPKEKLIEPGSAAKGTPTTKAGVFLEVKRLGRVDLSDKKITPGVKASPKTGSDEKGDEGIMRKPEVVKLAQGAGASAGAASTGGAAPTLTVETVEASATLFTKINVGTPDADANDVQLSSGKVSLKEKKFVKLAIDPTDTITKLRAGSYGVETMFVPAGKVLVQVKCRAPAKDTSEPWAWADNLADFELVDSAGTRVKPSGAWCRVKAASGQDRMIAQYDANGSVSSLPHSEGRPTDVWIGFIVPSGTQLTQVAFKGQALKELAQVVQ